MRRAVLLNSVVRVLGAGTEVEDAAYMWQRHRWMIPYAAGVFVGMVVLAGAVGWDDWATRIVLGFAAAAVAVTATTEYRVFALTNGGFYLLRASKIRQVATARFKDVPPDVELRPVGGTILAADWQIGEHVYTVSRSSEQAMQRMAIAETG